MFRLATITDTPEILRMLEDFYDQRKEFTGIDFDEHSTIKTIVNTITQGIVLLGEKSTAGSVITPFPFNHKAMVANVIFWWFKGPSQIRIFDELSRLSKEAGATHIYAASHPPDHVIGRYYEKRGLIKSELNHIGIL